MISEEDNKAAIDNFQKMLFSYLEGNEFDIHFGFTVKEDIVMNILVHI